MIKNIQSLILLTITCGILSGCQNKSDKQDSGAQTTVSDSSSAQATKDTSTTPATMPSEKSKTDTAVAPKADTTHAVTHKPLTIIIDDLSSPTAQVVMSIYGRQNKFPDKKGQMKEYKFTPTDTKLTIHLDDIPYGEYALASFQDLKNKGSISTNFMGIPTDPIGFSNNFRPKIKAPKFDDCKFTYDEKMNMFKMLK
jgi:uncharacterized protein (DUF2141 family)